MTKPFLSNTIRILETTTPSQFRINAITARSIVSQQYMEDLGSLRDKGVETEFNRDANTWTITDNEKVVTYSVELVTNEFMIINFESLVYVQRQSILGYQDWLPDAAQRAAADQRAEQAAKETIVTLDTTR